MGWGGDIRIQRRCSRRGRYGGKWVQGPTSNGKGLSGEVNFHLPRTGMTWYVPRTERRPM